MLTRIGIILTLLFAGTITLAQNEEQIPDEFFIQLLDMEETREDQLGIPEGEQFSDSTFLTTDGKPISFTDKQYPLTIVDFWFKGCRGCAQEKYYIKKLIEKYKDDPRIRFVAITPSSEKGIEKVKAKFGDYYEDIISVGGFKNCEALFKFKGFPRHVFVSKEGTVLANYRVPIFHPVMLKEYEKRMLDFLEQE